MFLTNKNGLKHPLTSSLSICITFIASFCLIALSNITSAVLNRTQVGWDILVLFLILVNASSFSPFSVMLGMGLLNLAFVILSYVPCIFRFSRTFIAKRCWTVPVAFSVSNEMIIGFCP